MPIFKIQHTTTYQYDHFVQESVNQVRIFAFLNNEQEVLQHDIHITGFPEVLTYNDYWGNKTGVFNVLPPHKELVIDSHLVVRTTSLPEPTFNRLAGFNLLEKEVSGNIKVQELVRPELIEESLAIDEISEKIYAPQKSVAEVVQNCCELIYKEFQYIKGITSVETTLDEILETKAGVCQDFAHVMLQVLRSLKIPSRYVSGYICPNKDGLRGEGATHAWVEAWIPTYGWAGIDPTNNVWVTNNHVKLAVGRNFNDCSPVKGTFKGLANQHLSVFVSVGYEDGHVVEELNNVKLPRREEIEQMIANFAAQQ